MNDRAALEAATERAADTELDDAATLADVFAAAPIPLPERLLNPGLFMRRQELSYLLANYEVFKQIQPVKGSVFYFGVFHGAGFMTFANLAAALEPFNHTREIVGFDTFTGYPEPSDADRSHGRGYRTLVPGGFTSPGKQTLEQLIGLYDRNRPLSHIPKTKLVEGDVMDTLPAYLDANRHTVVALTVLTMNLYEPTRLAIESVWPLTPAGGAIVIHSLNEDYYPGATRALFDTVPDAAICTFPFAPNLAYLVKP